VLPESVERKVDEVASDHQSGATHITIRALRAFDLLVASGSADQAAVRELRERLEAAQPAMASVRNVARMAATQLPHGIGQWPSFRDSLLRVLEEGRRHVAGNFLKVAPATSTVVTLSRSVNVFECCVVGAQRGRVQRVVVLESHPGLEGLRLAEDLRDANVTAEAIPDSEAAGHIDAESIGLAGADTVYADGAVVNKVGTRALAQALQTAGRPMYFACETIKLDPATSARGWTERASVGGTFDLTPPSLITGLITERGVWKPDQIGPLLLRPR